jgi:hypothetical protein
MMQSSSFKLYANIAISCSLLLDSTACQSVSQSLTHSLTQADRDRGRYGHLSPTRIPSHLSLTKPNVFSLLALKKKPDYKLGSFTHKLLNVIWLSFNPKIRSTPKPDLRDIFDTQNSLRPQARTFSLPPFFLCLSISFIILWVSINDLCFLVMCVCVCVCARACGI